MHDYNKMVLDEAHRFLYFQLQILFETETDL